tara:strand:+ start:548 stop:1117 length:570 start_codon:yes stop_codon:yes gene_type:complete
MIAVIIAAIAYVIFLVLSWAIIRSLAFTGEKHRKYNKIYPQGPKYVFFFVMIIMFLVYTVACVLVQGMDRTIDIVAWFTGLVCLLFACIAFINMIFYSMFWGFSTGIIACLYSSGDFITKNDLIKFYKSSGDQHDRIFYPRVQILKENGYIELANDTVSLTNKGRIIAMITKFICNFFSLGKGGGMNDV